MIIWEILTRASKRGASAQQWNKKPLDTAHHDAKSSYLTGRNAVSVHCEDVCKFDLQEQYM